ncbi:Multidrug/oligosaccharidyl-lipid/polysaccharide, partial [Globisporangium polare]
MVRVQETTPLLLQPKVSKPLVPVVPAEPEVDTRAEFFALLSMALQVSLSTFARLALT